MCRKRSHSGEFAASSAKMSSKKLINEAEKVVDDALEGLIATNPGVNAIENHRVVVRSDLENLKDKVAILCGGGSGKILKIFSSAN